MGAILDRRKGKRSQKEGGGSLQVLKMQGKKAAYITLAFTHFSTTVGTKAPVKTEKLYLSPRLATKNIAIQKAVLIDNAFENLSHSV